MFSSGKRKFMTVMAFVWGILAIIFYIISIQKVGNLQIANIQATTFCAASAVLCGINIVGALLFSGIEDALQAIDNAIISQQHKKEETQNNTGKPTMSNSKPSYLSSTTVNKATGIWTCRKCGTPNSAEARSCKDCGAYR